jgi:hypothetical protein
VGEKEVMHPPVWRSIFGIGAIKMYGWYLEEPKILYKPDL